MNKTILIVDDAASVRAILKSTLEKEGYQIIEAKNGLEATEKLKGQSFDLIVSDVNMPHMDGIQFLTNVRQDIRHRLTPVLILTTESGDMKEAAKKAGATGWINKPFDSEKLIKVLKKVLR